MTLEEQVLKAADQNLLIFDGTAEPGVFTERLLELMHQFMSSEIGTGIHKMYFERLNLQDILKNNPDIHIGQVFIGQSREFSALLKDEYRHDKDRYTVMAVDESGEKVLFGSY